MKILWQAHESGLSGANICLLEYLEVLQKEKFEQHIIVPGAGPMFEAIDKKLIPVSIIQSYPWMKTPSVKDKPTSIMRKFVRNRIAVKQTAKLIEKFNPDFVATNTIANSVAAYAANKNNKKHIWFIHEFGKEDHGYIIAGNVTKGKRIINSLSEKVVFNSKIIQDQYKQFVEPQKRFIVYNAVNIPEIKRQTRSYAGKIKIIMLGQIAPSKCPLDALKALNICLGKGLDVELNIVGSAEHKEYLQVLNEYIEKENLQMHVHFLGVTDRPETLLIQNDILLMCSRMEAFGRVTVEAHKCGLPVIAANSGGSVELIEEEVNGYLYESGNSEDLASKIIRYENNRSLFDNVRIANNACAKFNLINTGRQLQNVFN